jgi:putative ABC transport system permease protein
MIARNLVRHPAKAAVSALGIALAASILVLGHAFLVSFQLIGQVQFGMVQRENLTVVFNAPRPLRVRHELDRLPGVVRTEPLRFVPVRLRHGHRSRRVAIMGLEPGSELRQLVTSRFRTLPLPPEGLVLTAKLGEVLGVGAGDAVTVELLEGNRSVHTLPVAGLVDELLGLTAYQSAAALDRLVGGAAISGALLRTDPLREPELNAALKRTPATAGVTSRDAMRATFETTLAESFSIMVTVILFFAGGLAAAVVYNAARIALSERGRELASLRVLGFTRGEVARMLLGEQALLTAVAVPCGLALGYAWVAALTGIYQWELFRMPLVVPLASYLVAVAVVVVTAAVSGLLVWRRLNRMDLVAVLKTRE